MRHRPQRREEQGRRIAEGLLRARRHAPQPAERRSPRGAAAAAAAEGFVEGSATVEGRSDSGSSPASSAVEGRTEAAGRRLAPEARTEVSPKRLGVDCDCALSGMGMRALVAPPGFNSPTGMRGAGSLAGTPIGSIESDCASAGVGSRCSKGSCTDARGMERARAALPGLEGGRGWGLLGPSPLW